jgi:hypothetical protein
VLVHCKGSSGTIYEDAYKAEDHVEEEEEYGNGVVMGHLVQQ